MVIAIILGVIGFVAVLYLIGVVAMLAGGLLLVPYDVRRLAIEINASFATALFLGALLWPVLGRKPWTGPLL